MKGFIVWSEFSGRRRRQASLPRMRAVLRGGQPHLTTPARARNRSTAERSRWEGAPMRNERLPRTADLHTRGSFVGKAETS
jgi:hypothetical protein